MPAASFFARWSFRNMRALTLALALSSLALTGCGKKQAEGNSSAPDDVSSAQEVTTNDTTSIDAATGAAANMAADVDINESDNADSGDTRATNRSHAKPRAAAPAANASSDSTPEPLQPVTPPANSTAG
jgi:hypothetical protein